MPAKKRSLEEVDPCIEHEGAAAKRQVAAQQLQDAEEHVGYNTKHSAERDTANSAKPSPQVKHTVLHSRESTNGSRRLP